MYAFFTSNFFFARSVIKEIENKGYTIKEEHAYHAYDSLLSAMKFLVIAIVSIFNLAISSMLLFSPKEMRKSIINQEIKNGNLIKVEENNIVEENPKYSDDKIISYNVNNELTRDQKIEFLRQEYYRLTGKNIQNEKKKTYNKRKRK